MDFPNPPQSNRKLRVDFDPTGFRLLLHQKGQDLRWTQTAECPCSPLSVDQGLDLTGIDDIDSGTGNTLACPSCKGRGLIYHSPQNIRGVITHAEGEYLNSLYGGYREGLINISLNPENLPAFGDRLELTSSTMIYRETITMVSNVHLYDLRFPIAQRVNVDENNQDITHDVIYVHKTDPVTGLALVDGDITSSNGYDVVNGQFRRINGGTLPDGARCSITYFMHPTYTVVSYPNSVRDTQIIKKRPTDKFIHLPVRVQAKLEFLEAHV
jgi:hypothetical protein